MVPLINLSLKNCGVAPISTDGRFEARVQEQRTAEDGSIWSIYDGYFTEDGKMNGRGKITFAHGTVHEGEFVDDRLYGTGTINSQVFNSTGIFANGQLVEGRTVYANGNSEEGAFFDDYLNGFGKKTLVDSTILRGVFANGDLVKGKILYRDLSMEEGTFVSGRLHGFGTKVNSSGTTTQKGQFVNGELFASTIVAPTASS